MAAAPLRAEVSDAKWKEVVSAFKDDFSKKSIKFKKRAIDFLPIHDARTLKFIVEDKKLLSHKNWWIRGTAADRLSKVKSPELRKKLLAYATHSDKRVREGIMTALSMSGDRLDPPVIVKALQDKTWEVRRMACWAAGMQRVKEAVEPMINMIHHVNPRTGATIQEGETNPRVHSVLLFNLEEITGNTTIHTDVEQWRQYWERNKDRTLPRVKRFDVGSFGDIKLEVNDTFARKGSGPLVIALPSTQRSTVYYMPYFNQWMFVRWLFINLPPIDSFPDVQQNAQGDDIYPVDILVDAFEDMRKKRNVEKMVLLGHGFSCWIAAKYAQKYPDRVSGLILLNPYASNEDYSKAIDAAKRSASPDAQLWGKVSSYEMKIASALEGEIYDYYRSSAWLGPKSRNDIELNLLRRIWVDPNAKTIAIPPFDIRGEETSRVPTLMFFANKKNELTGAGSINRLRRYYPNNFIVPLKNKAARLPFMEAPQVFEKVLRRFIDEKIDR